MKMHPHPPAGPLLAKHPRPSAADYATRPATILKSTTCVRIFDNAPRALRLRPLLWLVAFGMLLGGCQHTTDPAPAPLPAASITGAVLVSDQQGQRLSPAGVVVTVADSSPAITATTSSDGHFTLPHLPAGPYELRFARPGISTFVLRGVPHVSADSVTRLPNAYQLYEEPAQQATNLVVLPAARPGLVTLEMTVRNPVPTNRFAMALYIGATPAVSLLDTRPCSNVGSYTSTASTSYTLSWTYDRADLLREGCTFASGTTVYAVLHGAGQQHTGYYDYIAGKYDYWPDNNMTPSPVVSFVMP